MPARTVTLDAMASWSTLTGPMAELSAALAVNRHLALWGAAQWRTTETRVLGGVRVGW